MTASRHHLGLALSLLARAGASGALSVYLLTRPLTWPQLFRAGAIYALVDGVLALIAGVVLARWLRGRVSQVLIAMTFADAAIRVVVAAGILWMPTIAELPMTLLPLFGVIGASAALIGVAALIIWTVERHRFRHIHTHGTQALFDPIPIVALLSIGVGTMLFVAPPGTAVQLRQVIATAGIVMGSAFLVSSVGAALNTAPAFDGGATRLP